MPPKWLSEARGLIGVLEWQGSASNPLIVSWWSSIHAKWFTDDATPWCASFVGHCLEKCGIISSRSAAALSYLKWGKKLNYAAQGAIAVMERKNKKGKVVGGHVAFVDGIDERGNIVCVGGNQGDAVSHASFHPSRIIAYRWPLSHPIPPIKPLPIFLGSIEKSDNEA